MRRFMLVTSLALAAFGITVAHATTVGTAGTPRSTAVVFGDSNIVWTATAMQTALIARNAPYLPVYIGKGESTTMWPDCPYPIAGCTDHLFWPHWLAYTRKHVGGVGAFVTDLGINDAWNAPATLDFGPRIDHIMASIPPTVPVLWSNQPCLNEPPNRQAACPAVNAGLLAATTRYPNLHVVDWSTVATPHPEWMQPASPHYTPTGNTAYATLITQVLDQYAIAS